MNGDLKQHGIFPTIFVFSLTIILLGFMARWYQGMTLANISDAVVSFAEKNVPTLDDPYWKELPQDESRAAVSKYIRASEEPAAWTEKLFTVKSRVPTPDFSLRQAAFDIVSVVQRICPTDSFQDYGVTKHEDGEVYYEWELIGCKALRDRHEIVRLVRRGEVLYGVHHVSRELPVTDRDRADWSRLLASLNIP